MTSHALATLAALRDAARARFAELGWPTTRLEEWRFTNVAPIAAVAWQPAPVDLPPPSLVSSGEMRLVFVNGRLASGLSSLGGLPGGVLVEDAVNAPDLLEPGVARDASGEAAFAALNAAEFDGGAVVEVPASVDAGTLELVFVAAPGGLPVAAYPRSLVRVGEGASLHVIERHVSAGGPSFTCLVADAVVGEGGSLE
jgi:Fe-S cluster assembly protein SufD